MTFVDYLLLLHRNKWRRLVPFDTMNMYSTWLRWFMYHGKASVIHISMFWPNGWLSNVPGISSGFVSCKVSSGWCSERRYGAKCDTVEWMCQACQSKVIPFYVAMYILVAVLLKNALSYDGRLMHWIHLMTWNIVTFTLWIAKSVDGEVRKCQDLEKD